MYVVMPPTSQCGFVIVGSVSFQNSAVRQSGTQRAPGCLPEVSIIVPGGSDCPPISFAVGVLTVFNGSAPHLPGLARPTTSNCRENNSLFGLESRISPEKKNVGQKTNLSICVKKNKRFSSETRISQESSPRELSKRALPRELF